jgi:DNA-binding NtrC family response regulator
MINSGRTILIVDDEVDMRTAIAYIFGKRGFNVLLAADGQEAYEITLNHNVDAIITDVRMPKMDGIELLKRVKSRMPNLPVVFLISGFADVSAEDALRLGASGLVQKPFDTKKIVMELEKAIANALKNSAGEFIL